MKSVTYTEDERRVLELLGAAWNRFAGLPVQHPADKDEMARAIHAAQNIVMARPAQRSNPAVTPIKSDS
jgi:hypothetical protein